MEDVASRFEFIGIKMPIHSPVEFLSLPLASKSLEPSMSGHEVALHGSLLTLPLCGSVQGHVKGQRSLLVAFQVSIALC